MCVETGVLEGAVALALVEMPAGNFSKSLSIFVDKFIFDCSIVNHLWRRNDQITILSAYWTCPIMSLLYLLVESCSPISNTVKTECMWTVFENTKPFSGTQHWSETNDTVFIALDLAVEAFLDLAYLADVEGFASRVHVFAAVSEFAVAFEEVFADDPVGVVF